MYDFPRPDPDEYEPFQAPYIVATRGTELFPLLRRQIDVLDGGCGALSENAARHRYGTGKWSIKEVVGHVTDAERIFAYRALRLGRGDITPLPGFDENQFVVAADFDARTMNSLLAEFTSVRAASIALLETFDPNEWMRRGTVNGSVTTVRAIAYVLAGHVQHHIGILRERYGLRV